MSDLAVSIIVILATGALAGLIFLLTRRAKKQEEARLRELAALRGWTFEPFRSRLAWGYCLASPSWELEAISSSSETSENSQEHVSHATTIRSAGFEDRGQLVAIGPRPEGMDALGGFGTTLVNMAIAKFTGRPGADMQEVRSASPELLRRYLILAETSAGAANPVSPSAEHTLLSWKAPLPVIRLTPSGVQIQISGRQYKKEGEILPLIELFENFTRTKS